MAPKLKIIRRVLNPPVIKGFKPFGSSSKILVTEPVNLLFEEYEALRLCDYEKCNHHQASMMMGVSRPTFTRIYASALQKIAVAFVEGRQISIEGGKIFFESDWYHCTGCDCYFNNPARETKTENCPLCGGQKIFSVEFDFSEVSLSAKGHNDFCVCPSCRFEIQHQNGKPCNQHICPICNNIMIRKRILKCKHKQIG